MRILSIDSSLGTQVTALDADPARDGGALEVLAAAGQDSPRAHAESLGPMLAQVLGDPRVADRPLDAVVAATGPAPFTGLRAGLVAARTVGRARSLPVHGIPSLDAVARLALDRLGTGRGAQHGGGQEAGSAPVVLVATDARRGEVYAARYRARGADDVERLDPLSVLPPAQARELGPFDLVAGSGLTLHPELGRAPAGAPGDGGALAGPVLVSGDALTQVRLALARLARGEQLSTEPIYLRHADVQMPSSRKRVS
ncbi:tRNA (adenosine(37)-N6)-threonylcarbamoyltransferase complex dimerization subunit type 1 TsaB [Actinomyces bowdenii]|uniref:tRNA (adenosine(37)-N6)-threonylcarbamoyltransferase complex dimerization subunit type 1 TsaB n=1 Tax=Actinomyces bowdenii TaxID=131109 RepID=UPI00214CBEFB|nr:tRNA (adenosine(37)-N6)-threonylcarbamoyltransferase complex dimerization subunit type 1 TsaB [Actinomyces bowdenii]